jgi:trans-aconitate 2-methyltransferase
MPQWDAGQYLKFNLERTQPVRDLLHRLRLAQPRRIVDLGCGPGNSTEVLRTHWTGSLVVGLDSSPDMIAQARQTFPDCAWQIADAAHWQAEQPYDLVFSNAMLQWLSNHEELCPRLLEQVAPSGALAVQAPAHYDSPLHREIIDVSCDLRWSDRMAGARRAMTNHPPEFYYDILRSRASRIDLWETTYYHVLAGPEEVLEWFRGSGLRPFLEALSSAEERRVFEEILLERYRVSYPVRKNGDILFPFKRLFFVAYR